MHSSTSSFDRPIPRADWRSVFTATLLAAILVTVGWELWARSAGYRPTLNDSRYLWADEREKVRPDSLVLIGASRILFDTDLTILEEGLGQKPIQLALTGSAFHPVLDDLLADEAFRGTLLIGVVPAMVPVPGGPPLERPRSAVKLWRERTPSEKFGQRIALHLEERIAFLKDEDLTLARLLAKLPIPNREGARVAPPLPPYFATVERHRRYRMHDEAARPGSALQQRVQSVWLPLFSPPPPPSYVPAEAFMAGMMEAGGKQFQAVVDSIKRARERGIKVVLVRFPSSGPLREHERAMAPRERVWDPLVALTGAPAIHFEDFPELAGFECPEWSHLSGPDSEEFTRRLVPLLKRALE